MRRRALALGAGLFVFSATFYCGTWLRTLEQERATIEQRQELEHHLDELHHKLHLELSAARTEVNALADWVSVQREDMAPGFDEISRRLISRHSTLLSTTDLPGDIIARTYPPNPALVGLDVGAHPIQGVSVVLMKKTRGPVVGGPIQLKQGGVGMILRAPVVSPEKHTYTGHASLVFDVGRLQQLLIEAAENRHLTVSLGDADNEGLTSKFRLASSEPASGTPSSASVELVRDMPFGQEHWKLAVRRSSPIATSLLSQALTYGSWLFALVSGIGAYWNVASVQRIRRRNIALAQSEQAALAARDTKAAFLATMSHELRTPMNGVIASAELLGEAELTIAQRELTTTIVESGRSLLHVINDILDFSKLESANVQLDPEPTSLRLLLNSLSDLFRPLAEQAGIGFELSISQELPEGALLDGHRLRQVITNLLSNAIKFTPQGCVTLHAQLDSGAFPPTLRFSVRDTGIGIEDTSHLFEEFAQADASTTRRFGGTGLGLSISKKLITLMGGSLDAHSTLGAGSTFTAVIPFTPAVLPRVSALPPVERLSPGTALIVDDNAVNRRIAMKVLNKFGWDATLASDGLEALQLVESAPFDLVLMDCAMPEMDGYEATRQIRNLGSDVAHIPVIAMTANALPEDKKRCLDAGMNDFLTKPLGLPEVREALKRHGPLHAPKGK